jgi:hypothetical protein
MSYATDFPAAQIASLLGERCVAELRQASPQPAADMFTWSDRFVINPGAISYWLFVHFGLNVFNHAEYARVADVNALAEVITLTGEDGGEFRIPHWCYLSTGLLDPDDPRPDRWPGIPHQTEEEPQP